jgi:TonB family protein
MKRLLLAAILLAACAKTETTPAEATDTREPIATEYVRGSSLPIHTKPDDASPVVTTYQASEAVSILARKGDWVEVTTAFGSGWAHANELASGAEMTASSQSSAGDSAPRFIIPPEPVSQPSAHGDITLEADVSPNGDVLGARIILNTTGSEGLASRNLTALQKAKFAPIVKHGQRMPFTYEHRVHY